METALKEYKNNIQTANYLMGIASLTARKCYLSNEFNLKDKISHMQVISHELFFEYHSMICTITFGFYNILTSF